MEKKMMMVCLMICFAGMMLVNGCGNWKFSGNTEKIQAGSPNNAPVDVIGVGAEKKF